MELIKFPTLCHKLVSAAKGRISTSGYQEKRNPFTLLESSQGKAQICSAKLSSLFPEAIKLSETPRVP